MSAPEQWAEFLDVVEPRPVRLRGAGLHVYAGRCPMPLPLTQTATDPDCPGCAVVTGEEA